MKHHEHEQHGSNALVHEHGQPVLLVSRRADVLGLIVDLSLGWIIHNYCIVSVDNYLLLHGRTHEVYSEVRRQVCLIQNSQFQQVETQQIADQLEEYSHKCKLKVVQNAKHAPDPASLLVVLLDQDADDDSRIKIPAIRYVAKQNNHNGIHQALRQYLIKNYLGLARI